MRGQRRNLTACSERTVSSASIEMARHGRWGGRDCFAFGKARQKRLRQRGNFQKDFNRFAESGQGPQDFASVFPKTVLISTRPASTRRGASADRHERGKKDAMDVQPWRDERGRADERNRAVPTPRRWRQASRETFAGATEAKKPGTPGRPRISRKPSRRECRVAPALPVVTAACVFCCRRAMGAACTRHSP